MPVSICGAEELQRGKRSSVRILPPTSAQALLGDAWRDQPEPDTRAELRVARAMTRPITERISAAVAQDHPGTIDPPGATRRWLWLTRLMR